MTPITSKTLEFLVENRLQDNREWYAAHKQQFTTLVLEPLRDFVGAVSPTLVDIDPQIITEPKVDRTISRVYRDTRFSRDKSLYRDHMWCVFMRDKKLFHGPPAFYFEIEPGGFRYGCGYYQASPAEMQALRDLVLENTREFQAARRAFEAQDIFGIEGDLYKRPRYPDADKALWPWLNRKNIVFSHNSQDADLLFSDKLAQTVAAHFRLLAPVYHFFLAAHARAPR